MHVGSLGSRRMQLLARAEAARQLRISSSPSAQAAVRLRPPLLPSTSVFAREASSYRGNASVAKGDAGLVAAPMPDGVLPHLRGVLNDALEQTTHPQRRRLSSQAQHHDDRCVLCDCMLQL